MTDEERIKFRRLPYNLQEFYLKQTEQGMYLNIDLVAMEYNQSIRKEEEARKELALSTGSFVLITNNERVKEAYRKLIANKPNTEFNG
jgi:hypothetical protein